jgi:hypothetical protein
MYALSFVVIRPHQQLGARLRSSSAHHGNWSSSSSSSSSSPFVVIPSAARDLLQTLCFALPFPAAFPEPRSGRTSNSAHAFAFRCHPERSEGPASNAWAVASQRFFMLSRADIFTRRPRRGIYGLRLRRNETGNARFDSATCALRACMARIVGSADVTCSAMRCSSGGRATPPRRAA